MGRGDDVAQVEVTSACEKPMDESSMKAQLLESNCSISRGEIVVARGNNSEDVTPRE
jgi:hypothetical protein